MSETCFWLIRHAVVEENARSYLYGVMDVDLCPYSRAAQGAMYRALALRMPRPAHWVATPLSRTTRTAEGIFDAGYPAAPLAIEPGLTEQHLGDWQGLAHAALPAKLSRPAHAFWPLAGEERPPGGESMTAVIARVGATLERLAREQAGRDVVAVSHGGTIRAAVAYALRINADSALHLSVHNLSLTRLEAHPAGWRVVCVNAPPGEESA